MKNFSITISVLAPILFYYVSLADTPQNDLDNIDIYVDGKLASKVAKEQLHNSFKLRLQDIDEIPAQKNWFSVTIKGSKGTDLSFQNWQHHFKGKEINLFTRDNIYHASLNNSGDLKTNQKSLYLQEHTKVIYINTKAPVTIPKTKPPLPDLHITIDGETRLLDYRHLNEQSKHGWQLEEVLTSLKKGAMKRKPFKEFELSCSNNTVKLALSRQLAPLTFIKVNQRSQWRAIVIDGSNSSKKNWKKCRNLTEITLLQ